MNFKFRHYHRKLYPTRHILICEDLIIFQKQIISHLNEMFEPDGLVQISIVSGSLAASAIIHHCKIDLIILDHDMPEGDGSDLLNWMSKHNVKIPVITFSGIPANNTHMGNLGAQYIFGKGEVIEGKADSIIKEILGL